MVQYDRDIWQKSSHMIAPLTDLIAECGVIKTMIAKGTVKKKWHWDSVHQETFDQIKKTLAKIALLAYPDYSSLFEIYTGASNRQLEPVNMQFGVPLALFNCKLSESQQK